MGSFGLKHVDKRWDITNMIEHVYHMFRSITACCRFKTKMRELALVFFSRNILNLTGISVDDFVLISTIDWVPFNSCAILVSV